MKKNILFIGYGDLGSRLASIGQDDLVITGISRSLKPTIAPDQYHSLDWFSNPAQKVDLLKNYDCLVITLTPTSFDEAGYEKGYEEGMETISKLVKNISFSKSNDDNLWELIMERKSHSKYLFYRTRIQFYPRHKYSLEVDQDLDLPTSPEFFKRRFKQMKSVLNL